MNKTVAFFGGAGIGLLIGVLVGMTTSGIVGTIIGTLATIVLAFFNDKDKVSMETKALRIGAFGFFCVIGILGGLFLRVQNTFAPSPTSEIKKWMEDSLFTKEEAKAYYIYDRFAFMPKGYDIDTTKNRKISQTLLYSSEHFESDCEQLEAYSSFSTKNKLDAYASLSQFWKNEIEAIKHSTQDESEQEHLLITLKSKICND